jgi:hypothetical protein
MSNLEDSGLEDISMRISSSHWSEMSIELLRKKRFLELATLHITKQAVARHQLCRDWFAKDMFLFPLEDEGVSGETVEILVGRTKFSKTNHYIRAEHFGFFRNRNVMECAWGWKVEAMVS